MAFHVGQKVVCVSDDWLQPVSDENLPRKGNVYTVRGVRPNSFPELHSQALLLNEVVNKPKRYKEGVFECDFSAHRFRPVVERKTDISIFTAMLNPSDKKVDA